MPRTRKSLPLRKGEKVAAATNYANLVVVFTDKGRILRLHPTGKPADGDWSWKVSPCEVEEGL